MKILQLILLISAMFAAINVTAVAQDARPVPRSADFIAKGKYMVGLAPTVGFGSNIGAIIGGRMYGGYFWNERNLAGLALRNYTQLKSGPVSLSQSVGVFNRFYFNRHRLAFYAEGGINAGYYHSWAQTEPQRPATSGMFSYVSVAVGTTLKLSRRASLDFRVGDSPVLFIGNGTWSGTVWYLGANIHLP